MNRILKSVSSLAVFSLAVALAAPAPGLCLPGAAPPRSRAVLRQPRDRGRPALPGREIHRLPEAVEGDAQRLGEEDGEPYSAARLVTADAEAARSPASSGAATANTSCSSGQGRRRELQRLRRRSRGSRRRGPGGARRRGTSPTPRARARPSTPLPKADPDVIYVGLNDRDAAWHDVYQVRISTGERKLVRQNTERISGWNFDLAGKLRLAERVADNRRQRGPAHRSRRPHQGVLVHRLRELRGARASTRTASARTWRRTRATRT